MCEHITLLHLEMATPYSYSHPTLGRIRQSKAKEALTLRSPSKSKQGWWAAALVLSVCEPRLRHGDYYSTYKAT
jgi:hypothetical protein